jgi:ABC-type bacteriocin/lantibiotic exporter with double-glycine peptidase domain
VSQKASELPLIPVVVVVVVVVMVVMVVMVVVVVVVVMVVVVVVVVLCLFYFSTIKNRQANNQPITDAGNEQVKSLSFRLLSRNLRGTRRVDQNCGILTNRTNDRTDSKPTKTSIHTQSKQRRRKS